MPELPEVETVKNILLPLIKDRTITKVEVFYDRLVQSNLNDFKNNLINKKFINLDRYGKFLFFRLSDNYTLISHLRMEGKYRYTNKDFRIKSTTAIFYLDNGYSLSYDDTRKFGLMYLCKNEEVKNLEFIKKLGIEANKITLSDFSYLKNKLNKNKKIKELLLDQTIMAGIGNIYADEILYASKINPNRLGKSLNDDEIKNIIINAKIILDRAIALGGSTIHSFHPQEGVDGKFQESLMCYGKESEICPNCGTHFHKIFIGGRGTTFCPNCQIDYNYKKAIGITGPIGSGKTTLLNHLKDLGYTIYNSDEIVHNLYKEGYIKNKLSRILHTNFDYEDLKSREIVRNILITNKEKKKEVEDYIYPILENYLLNEISKNDLIAIEVPLLFKAHFEYMFKKIFVIKLNKEKQISNLNNRHINEEKMMKLNNDYNYNKNNLDVVIIENNGDLEAFLKNFDNLLNNN